MCASAGDANQAFAVFQKAKAAEQQLSAAAAAAAAAAGADSRQQAAAGRAAPKMDGHVYGALIAACAQAIRMRSSDLREQLVVLERAFQVGHVVGFRGRLTGRVEGLMGSCSTCWASGLQGQGRATAVVVGVALPADPLGYCGDSRGMHSSGSSSSHSNHNSGCGTGKANGLQQQL